MPDDEVLEYLATQAIADFLATENDPVLDGIVFPSVQAAGDGLNVVLFHKAARVEKMDIPEGAIIKASTGYASEDGWEVDYSVTESMPTKQPKEQDKGPHWPDLTAFTGDAYRSLDSDSRGVTLRIVLESLKIHFVRKVQFECDVHNVWRHQFNIDNTKF